MKSIKINLPKKYEYLEGVSRPEYKKFNGWNKISYSQYTSFKDYKYGYLQDYIIGVGSDESGIFARFGSDCGDYLNPNEEREFELLSSRDKEILDGLKKEHPKDADFEYEIVIDLEPFGLEKTCIQAFTDRQYFKNDKLNINDYKTLSLKTKKSFYESDEYKQLLVYGYGLEELAFNIGDTYVTGLDRKGNNLVKGDKNVLRLTGEVEIIPKPYDRKKAISAIEDIVRTVKEITEMKNVYDKFLS